MTAMIGMFLLGLFLGALLMYLAFAEKAKLQIRAKIRRREERRLIAADRFARRRPDAGPPARIHSAKVKRSKRKA